MKIKLTIKQSTILRLIAEQPNQLWYPRDEREWVEGKRISLSGQGVAAIIPTLHRKGLIEMCPNVSKYTSKLTELGKQIAEQEKGKPLAFVREQ